MGYLKNKTFGFYLSFVAAILALIGFVMYRQSGHTESYIEVLLLVTVVLQILAMIVLKVAPDFKWTSLLLTANAILTAAALVNSFYTQVDFIGYVVSGLYEFATIKKFIISLQNFRRNKLIPPKFFVLIYFISLLLIFTYCPASILFLIIKYEVITIVPVITHVTGYTFISIVNVGTTLNTVYNHTTLNPQEPITVSSAGRSECPIPLSAPPDISYTPVRHSSKVTCFILIIAYFIATGSFV